MKVDDTQLAQLEEKARKDLIQDKAFLAQAREALADRGKTAPSELEAVLSRALDLVSYRLRKFLSGKELSPLAVASEYERILAQAKTETLAALRGLSAPQDEVANQILKKLRDDLRLLEDLRNLSSPRAEAALFASYLEGGLERALAVAPGVLREDDQLLRREAELSLFWKRLLALVQAGKLYRFEAQRLMQGLSALPEKGARETLRRTIIEILQRR